MLRQLAVIALVALCAHARPIESVEEIPEQYKAMIPKEVLEQLQSITAEEKVVLKELVKKHSEYKNEDEFLAALKEKSPSLHEKALKLHNLVNEKVDKLGDEAKSFVKKVLAEARKIHHQYLAGEKPSIDQLKTISKDHLAAFNALSDGAKEEFKTQFPILTSVFTIPGRPESEVALSPREGPQAAQPGQGEGRQARRRGQELRQEGSRRGPQDPPPVPRRREAQHRPAQDHRQGPPRRLQRPVRRRQGRVQDPVPHPHLRLHQPQDQGSGRPVPPELKSPRGTKKSNYIAQSMMIGY